MAGEHEAAVREAEESMRLNPSMPSGFAVAAMILAYSGPEGYERASELFDHAERLSPRDPFLVYWHTNRGMGELFRGNHQGAIDWARKALQRHSHPLAKRLLASAYAHTGDLDQASTMISELEQIEPGFTIGKLRSRAGPMFKRNGDLDVLVEGLRLAGAKA
jgi:tetratricopeptide (TPR) repeat protein